MIALAIIPIAAICNVMRGRGYKLVSGVVLAACVTAICWGK